METSQQHNINSELLQNSANISTSQAVVGSVIEVHPTMVSPSAVEIVSQDFSDSNMGAAAQQENGYCADVLKITPSIVIGKVVGQSANQFH